MLATQLPRPASGVFFTVTLVTLPSGLTLTETLTCPLAENFSPHDVTRAFTLATPSEIIARSSDSGRSLLPPDAGDDLRRRRQGDHRAIERLGQIALAARRRRASARLAAALELRAAR